MNPVDPRKPRPAHDPDFAGAARALSRALLGVHKELLELARIEYERANGRQNPAQMWNLLIGDPFFAWLRPLSGAVAQLDELLATESDRSPYRRLVGNLRPMLVGDDPSDPFAGPYARYRQLPEVIAAHAVARRALETFEETLGPADR